jgi:hypothetical protein
MCNTAQRILSVLVVMMLLFGTGGTAAHAQTMDDGLAAARSGDYAKAFKIMRPFADRGVAVAQGYIGIMYRDGRGVQQSDTEAVKWFQRAAENGEMFSRTNLAVMFLNGRGVAQDYSAALKWLLLAASQGDALAYQILGEMYANGLGVAVDHVHALYWFELAVLKRRTEAVKARDILVAQSNSSDRAIVEEAVEKCRSFGYVGCSPLPSDPLLRLPATLLAQEMLAHKVVMARVFTQIDAGVTVSTVNIAGKEWKVTRDNLDEFVGKMQTSIDLLRRVAELRGYSQIAGRYSIEAGSRCKGDSFDISETFATLDASGRRVLLKEVTIAQTGPEIEIWVNSRDEGGESKHHVLPAVLVKNALIVGNLAFEPFFLRGTFNGSRIDLHLDEGELQTLYGVNAGSEADWAQVRECFVSFTALSK